MARPERIIFSTGNEGKLKEVAKALEPLGIEVLQKDMGYYEVQTTSLEEVARIGMQEIIARGDVSEPVLIDDSGLFVESLKGFPGVYSAFVLKAVGYQGVLRLMAGATDRRAYFDACLSYYDPKMDEPLYFHGLCNGIISTQAMEGEFGFGFDPIFHPLLGERTDYEESMGEASTVDPRSFSQIPTQEKNLFSHRGKAVAKLVEWLESQ